MPHTIELDEMLAWIESKKDEGMPYAQCGTKRLILKLSGGYRVVTRENSARGHEERAVYDGTDGRSAVEAYNRLP